MNILMLGATGYLGGNIVNRLVKDGHDITCIVRSTSDISRLKSMKVCLILNELDAIELYLKCNDVDCVINGICTYKMNDSLYGDILTSNIIFPLSVLNLAVKYNVKKFITMGTSLPENINIYSFSKYKFSGFGKYISDQDGIDFADLQLEMFYGGLFEPSNRFISSCKNKLKNNEILLLTEGTQKRDAIRVEDIVNIISLLISTDYIKGYKILPIGCGEKHQIKEIIEFMKNEMCSQSELKFGAIPSRINEPDTVADISWYSELGYKLQYSFFEGLRKECLDI